MSNPAIPSILKRIVATKQQEVSDAKAQHSLASLQAKAEQTDTKQKIATSRHSFAGALQQKQAQQQIGIIAEIKKASPSKGIINHNFEPELFAQQYEQAGAACLSVLTDVEYFQGSNDYLRQAKAACHLPVLRKDFMIDEYQIYQSYLLGADCILLIMACLDDEQVQKLHEIACQLGMDVLIEIHSQQELERALKLPQSEHNIYGINNRDLNTFNTDLNTSLTLANQLQTALQHPLIVSESGIHTPADIKLMTDANISSFLIGEQFMKTSHPGKQLQTLLDSVATSQ
ncbi:indole-3-glycerol phosphate synthase TrpC [Psychrobacter sp. I-STPA10]|uniref:indole-3-glycerol phosphate synthase TrpC n=1 Tax=Psychrobacter sp. I-STPA10 TaxID=2585769 RepID=UPI001E2B3953|nr:indole-3-glycerol phosphate synthase TrpC [Psychrobacter sp. I-STPA10]